MLVLVINLKEDQERLDQISKAHKFWNIDFVRIDAVRGSKIDRENNPEIFNGEFTIIRHNFLSKTTLTGHLTDGELGCALSHLEAYKYILNSGEKEAIILEDDFVPNCNVIDVFTKALKCKPDAEIITGAGPLRTGLRHAFWSRLHYISGTDRKIMRVGIPGLDWFFNRRRRHSLTSCYYIKAQTCEHLMKLAYPVRLESDVLIGMVAFNKVKYYTIQPSLGETRGVSSIQDHGGAKFS